jgi:phage terminase large subunit-like protein
MTSAPVELQGAQRPRVLSLPPSSASTGPEAIELCEAAGLYLDPWQQFVLTASLGERPDGQWSAFEVGLVAPRQNGKDEIVIARELAGLFLLGERLITHTAHEFATAMEHFRRLREIIENCPEFYNRLPNNRSHGITEGNGKEGIELKNGQRFRLKARTKGSGRGFVGDLVLLNEAMELSEASMAALLPTLSSRPNPQIWYLGSAVDQWVHDNGMVFARVRERGHAGDEQRLAFMEFSHDADNPSHVTEAEASDPEVWAQANPALGIRISTEYIADERRAFGGDIRSFAVERLCVGDWPRTDGQEEQVIAAENVAACLDVESEVLDPLTFAFDVTPDRSSASIGVAGRREDGLGHIEVVDRREGSRWVVKRLLELVDKHPTSKVLCDAAGPAASLLLELEPALEQRGIELELITTADLGRACGLLFDDFKERALRHLGTSELMTAIKGAKKRPLSGGEAWGWSRKNSAVDISPLVAVTLAWWGAAAEDESEEPLFAVR